MKILAYADFPDLRNTHVYRVPLALTDASLLSGGKPQFLPDEEHVYKLYPCAALLLQNTGRKIAPRFIHRYVEKAGAAALLVDHSELERSHRCGLPYTAAVSFDFNVARGNMFAFDAEAFGSLVLRYHIGDTVCDWPCEEMAPDWRQRLADLSRIYTFRTGDLVLPAIGPPVTVSVNTHVTAGVLDKERKNETNIILEYNIK